MCPTVNTIDLDSTDTDEVYVSLGVVDEELLENILSLLPELRRELTPRWPVKDFLFKRRNPFYPEHSVTFLYIALAGSLAKAIGAKLGDEAFEWLKGRVKGLRRKRRKDAKGKAPRRRRNPR